MTTKKWRALVRAMRKGLPTGADVVVRRRPMKRNCGVTNFDGETYRVYVDSTQDDRGQIDTLTHEWAHVLAIEAAFGHGEAFGEAFAKSYCICEDHFELEVT